MKSTVAVVSTCFCLVVSSFVARALLAQEGVELDAYEPTPTIFLTYTAGVPPTETPVPTEAIPIIAAGQEELMAKMFAKGEKLAADCQFSGGEVKGDYIRGNFKCGETKEIGFELRHRDRVPADTVVTERFGIVTVAGQPPEGFVAALAERVRSHENAFQWGTAIRKIQTTTQPAVANSRGGAQVVAVVVAAFALWLLFRRRRRQT